MNKITTLITGGAGFIGSTLADKLLELDYRVIIIDDLSTGQIKNIPKKATFIALDIGQSNALRKLTQLFREYSVDYIFHCASIPRTQYSVEYPIECNQANVNGTLNILEAARLCGHDIKKIIHSSSCGIYGKQETMPISEDAPVNMGTPYSVQKYIQEHYMHLYSQLYDVPTIMLRYFNVYGTHRQSENGSYPNVLAAFNKQKKENDKLFVTGSGEQIRDIIHVNDVINANIVAMKSNFIQAEVFNIGTGKYVTINKIAKYFECPIKYIPARPGEAFELIADVTKAKKYLKWESSISYDEGIKSYLNN